MPELREYVDEFGRSRHGEWLQSLDQFDQARILLRLDRLSLGSTSNVKSVGSGVMELKIDFGPGYRVYFGREGERLILLLGGGTKRHQQRDITAAHAAWQAYKRRKAAGGIQWH